MMVASICTAHEVLKHLDAAERWWQTQAEQGSAPYKW